jgi:Spy/CpxP family protein refolding chaperone
MKRLIVLLIVAVASAMAQGPEGFPWWERPIAKNLNLSPEQQKQIQATVREYRDRLIEQRAIVQKAEARLQDEMNEDQVSEARANDAIEKLVAARSEMARTVSQMSLKLRVVLTPQQWQRLRERIVQQGPQQRQQMRRGPGAMRKQPAPGPPGPDQ